MRGIASKTRTIEELFAASAFSIDAYQRDYIWGADPVRKLIDDLVEAFRSREQTDHDESRPYFLGPIITHRRFDVDFIVDGQQRLTTLLLLLIWARRHVISTQMQDRLDRLIRPVHAQNDGFVLAVDDYRRVFAHLYLEGAFDEQNATAAERAIAQRYADIDDYFPTDLRESALAAFAVWLITHGTFVEITAADDDMAFRMFETMNNRGQPLRPADMFKHFLLARIDDEDERNIAHDQFRTETLKLQRMGPDEDIAAIRAVLQARYSVAAGDATSPAAARTFYGLMRDAAATSLGDGQLDFAKLMGRDLVFYLARYREIREAARSYTAGREALYFVGRIGLPGAIWVLLAPLEPSDAPEIVERKLATGIAFCDVFAARKAWSPRLLTPRALERAMADTARQARGMDARTLSFFLAAQVGALAPSFAVSPDLSLETAKKSELHSLLARLYAYVDWHVLGVDRYPLYEARTGAQAFEVEMIPPLDPRTAPLGAPTADYLHSRRLLGALAVLPRALARETRDQSFVDKRHALSEASLLTASLTHRPWRDHAKLGELAARLGGRLGPFDRFSPSDIAQRQAALRSLADRVWNPHRIIEAADATLS